MRGSRKRMGQNEHPSVSWSPSLRTTSGFQALWKHRKKSCKRRTTLNPLSALHLSERISPPTLNTCRADAGSSCCKALDWQYQVSQQSQTSRLTWQVARNRQCQVVRCQQPGVVIRKWLPPPIVGLQTLCCQENRCSRFQPKQSLLLKEMSRRLSLTACCLLSSYTGHCWQHLLSAKEKFPYRVFTFNCTQVTLHPQTSLLWLPTNQDDFGSQVLVHVTLLPENYTKEENQKGV